ncbi:MAG: hypothetical protein ACTMIR_12925 [Cellulomonadaceae bacterium]
MDNEIELISDGDGLAVIGKSTAVERFLASHDLASKDLGLQRLRPAVGAAAGATQITSEVVANYGRWVKLSEKSARLAKTQNLMKGSEAGLSRAVAVTEKGKITNLLEFSTRGTLLTNPAVLSGIGGLMAQQAMQQAMDEIADYLAVIDAKVDDVLRAQKDAVLSDMIGVDFVIEEAMTVRNQVGRVSEVTWSKVQGSSATIGRTQAYALRQLDALAEKLERNTKIGDLAATAKGAQSTVQEWLAVLARCFQLQDALSILELDRVLDGAAQDLDQHRLGLKAARRNRLELISQSTAQLLARIDATATFANSKVLLHPMDSRAVVDASNQVAHGIVEFHDRLGIGSGRESFNGKRWVDAVAEVKDKVVETGAEGVGAARQLGDEGIGRALSFGARASSKLTNRLERARVERDAKLGPPEVLEPAEADEESPRSDKDKKSFLRRRGDE